MDLLFYFFWKVTLSAKVTWYIFVVQEYETYQSWLRNIAKTLSWLRINFHIYKRKCISASHGNQTQDFMMEVRVGLLLDKLGTMDLFSFKIKYSIHWYMKC